MNKASRTNLYLRTARKAALTLSVGIAIGIAGGTARAQLVTIDPAHIAQDVANFGKTMAQYAKELAHYQAVVQHYQQQLIRLTHMDFTLPTMQNSYEEISSSDARDQVARACPSTRTDGVAGAVTGLLQIFTPDVNKSLLENQRIICEQVQFRQIDKYNLTVKMMNRLKDYTKKLESLQKQQDDGGTSEGSLAGTMSNMQMNSLALDNEMQTWTGQIQADDQMIVYLQSQKSVQAREIFNGSNTIIGNVIQAGAFAAAFH